MSVADVQRAFVRGLNGRASCKGAWTSYEAGGQLQRLEFHVTGSLGQAFLSEAIEADMCPMQHARHMAAEFLEGRIAGQSAYAIRTQPAMQDRGEMQLAFAGAPNATQAPTVPALPDKNAASQVTSVQNSPPGIVSGYAGQQAPDMDVLVEAVKEGNLAKVIDELCLYVDRDAGEARLANISFSDGQSLEYDQVRREIHDLAYQLIAPSPENCPALWASVGVDVPSTGDNIADIYAAASVINRHIDSVNDFLTKIRSIRLAAKSAIKSSASIDEALSTYQAIVW